jgi:hypothetical protein
MTAETFDRYLRAFTRVKPFRSFTVELVSGDRFSVDHPEALVFRSGTAVYIDPKGTPVIFDHEGVAQLIGRKQKGTPN